jgi:hypothetical protein
MNSQRVMYIVYVLILFVAISCNRVQNGKSKVGKIVCVEEYFNIKTSYKNSSFEIDKLSGNLTIETESLEDKKWNLVCMYNNQGVLIKKYNIDKKNRQMIGHYYEFHLNGLLKYYCYYKPNYSKDSILPFELFSNNVGSIDSIHGDYLVDKAFNKSKSMVRLIFPKIAQLRNEFIVNSYDSTGTNPILAGKYYDITEINSFQIDKNAKSLEVIWRFDNLFHDEFGTDKSIINIE